MEWAFSDASHVVEPDLDLEHFDARSNLWLFATILRLFLCSLCGLITRCHTAIGLCQKHGGCTLSLKVFKRMVCVYWHPHVYQYWWLPSWILYCTERENCHSFQGSVVLVSWLIGVLFHTRQGKHLQCSSDFVHRDTVVVKEEKVFILVSTRNTNASLRQLLT